MSKQDGRVAQLRLQLQWDYLNQLLADSEEPAYYEATARMFFDDAMLGTEKNPVLDELNRIHCQYWGN